MRAIAEVVGALVLSASACLDGCAPVDEDDEAAASADAVVAGSATFDRPEIGAVFHGGALCTGTLVRPNVVLTAAHCTGFVKDLDVTGATPGFVFEIRKSATEKRRFAVDRVHAIASPADLDGSQRWRSRDIALLRLVEAVPRSLAAPAGIAPSWPALGASVAIYGFGCTDREAGEDGRRPGTGTKRWKPYRWTLGLKLGFTDTQNVCQGDSGGPLLDLDRNVVVGTNSGYVGGDDRYGDVPGNFEAVSRIADAWASRR